ncbi:MAG: pyridoxal-phosphate dependent enzyme [Melioribacteraceae bacterium]|nr:pyridoxal-phosphate dependent enzyme [Melioribacteraceae bacterium]MCF8354989.1 pyridoxal-phosphate dependent enzyme [Melioribacteraceae bacterium]MCF8394314.1 pyridoxal-phosphate dependent enzyme [Melioribacteraceae bacterium]MCF8419993.1 pyridoxal-phosphate dependent enzyme [Melioribacteraceae bacterium]
MNEKHDENINRIEYTEQPYDLIDGATAEVFDFYRELTKQREVAVDKSLTLDERIAAYEDIIDSEVGDTNLVRARNIEREFGIRQIYLKYEGGNPSGTQKDRIAFAQCNDALRRGYDTITFATCGNYGVAIALAANFAGLKCIIHIPENYHTKRIKEMADLGAEIIREPGDYENAVFISQEFALKNEQYDANPGGDNTILQLKAYGEIAYEIYDDLRDAPSAISIPVSNGTTLAGVYRGFLSLYRRGKTSRMPKIIAGSSIKKNPIVEAFLLNKEKCEDLRPEKIKETKVNEPLVNWHSFDGDYALEAIRNTKGWAGSATDKEMTALSKLIREKEGLFVLPASTAGLHALIEKHKKDVLPSDRYVVLLTGRKS